MESSSIFRELSVFNRVFRNWACNLFDCIELIILFQLFTKSLQHRASNIGKYVLNNVAGTSGLIQFMSHASVPCSSKKLSKAIAILQLFVKKPVALRTYSLDSDCIFCKFHLHNAVACSSASSHDNLHAVTSTSSLC